VLKPVNPALALEGVFKLALWQKIWPVPVKADAPTAVEKAWFAADTIWVRLALKLLPVFRATPADVD
jgi:hypothetical protein